MQYFGWISRGKGDEKWPGPSRTAGSGAHWQHSRVEGRQRSMAITWDEWKTILTGTAEIWDMDISNSLRMILFFYVFFFFWGGRVYTIMGPPWSTTSCNVKPTPSLQASERSESRASLHSGNVAWTKIQLVAGYYMSFGGKTQVGYPPHTHTQKKKNNSHPLSTRYSCYLALSMGHWTKEVNDRNDFPSPCASITPSTFKYVLSFFV